MTGASLRLGPGNYKRVFELGINSVAGIHFVKLSSKLHFLTSLEKHF